MGKQFQFVFEFSSKGGFMCRFFVVIGSYFQVFATEKNTFANIDLSFISVYFCLSG